MDASKEFPEKFFKGDDFINREITLTTCEISKQPVFNKRTSKEELKITMFFDETRAKAARDGKQEDEKRIVLSKTLYVDFVGMFGSKMTQDWEKKRITFYRGPALGGGKQVIRARLASETKPIETPSTETQSQ